MTSFTTQTNEHASSYRLIFETDNKEYFEHMQCEARRCIDHLKEYPGETILNSDISWNDCRWSRGSLLHNGYWQSGHWYEWLDIYGNTEVARMKDDAWDHFYPPTKIIKEENVIGFRDIRDIRRDTDEETLSKN